MIDGHKMSLVIFGKQAQVDVDQLLFVLYRCGSTVY